MKVCSGCQHEYNEEFKFCPECGHKFGAATDDLERRLNDNLNQMKFAASREAALSRRVFGGQGLGDSKIGPVFGRGNEEGHSDLQ